MSQSDEALSFFEKERDRLAKEITSASKFNKVLLWTYPTLRALKSCYPLPTG